MPWWAWLLLGIYIAGVLFTFRAIVICNLYRWHNYMFEALSYGFLWCWFWPIALPSVYYHMYHKNLDGLAAWSKKYIFPDYRRLDA